MEYLQAISMMMMVVMESVIYVECISSVIIRKGENTNRQKCSKEIYYKRPPPDGAPIVNNIYFLGTSNKNQLGNGRLCRHLPSLSNESGLPYPLDPSSLASAWTTAAADDDEDEDE